MEKRNEKINYTKEFIQREGGRERPKRGENGDEEGKRGEER